MKNVSIRTKILGGVIIVNLLGALVVVVYLHQSFSKGLDDAATRTVTQGVAAWEQLAGPGTLLDPVASPDKITGTLKKMSAITGAQYGFLLDKSATTAKAYAAMRERQNLPNNWDEGDTYALLAVSDPAAASKIRFSVPAGDVPETGKVVGVENGACAGTCHNTIAGRGDYWTVRWSPDSKTRSHAVFPVEAAGGKPIGVAYAIDDLSGQANRNRDSLFQTLGVVGITLLAAAVVIGGLVDSLVLLRLRRMTTSMEDIGLRVAGGDYNAHFQPEGTDDEIGSFEEFFAQLMDLVSSTLGRLSKQQEG